MVVIVVFVFLVCIGGGEQLELDVGQGFFDDGCIYIMVVILFEKVNMFDEFVVVFKEFFEYDGFEVCVMVCLINVFFGNVVCYFILGDDWLSDDCVLWLILWFFVFMVWIEWVVVVVLFMFVGEFVLFMWMLVVFGMLELMVKVFGWFDKLISIIDFEVLCQNFEGWGSVGKDIWGVFKIFKMNLNILIMGLLIILMQFYEVLGKVEGFIVVDVDVVVDFFCVFEECVIYYGDMMGNVFFILYDEMQNGVNGLVYVLVVVLEEILLFNYNKGNFDLYIVQFGEILILLKMKFVVVYLVGGLMWLDNLIIVFGVDWVMVEQCMVGEVFVVFLQIMLVQEIFFEYGFCFFDEVVLFGDLFIVNFGVDLVQFMVILLKLEVDVIFIVIDQWMQVCKLLFVFEFIDILGLMDEFIGDGCFWLDGVIEGVQIIFDYFCFIDEVGVWVFMIGVFFDQGEGFQVL